MNKDKIIELASQGSFAVSKLLLTNYARLGLNEEEFMLILHLQTFIDNGNAFPTPDQLSERMYGSSTRCMELLRKLIQKGYISIEETTDNHILFESYSIYPLWEKLVHVLYEQEKEQQRQQHQQVEMDLYTMFEKEFGRPLSPMECETLTIWLDQDNHPTALIKTALRESVLSGKLNFRYIDRILFEWKKNGIQTVEQAKQQGQKFRKYNQTKQRPTEEGNEENKSSIPFFNWLEQQ